MTTSKRASAGVEADRHDSFWTGSADRFRIEMHTLGTDANIRQSEQVFGHGWLQGRKGNEVKEGRVVGWEKVRGTRTVVRDLTSRARQAGQECL